MNVDAVICYLVIIIYVENCTFDCNKGLVFLLINVFAMNLTSFIHFLLHFQYNLFILLCFIFLSYSWLYLLCIVWNGMLLLGTFLIVC